MRTPHSLIWGRSARGYSDGQRLLDQKVGRGDDLPVLCAMCNGVIRPDPLWSGPNGGVNNTSIREKGFACSVMNDSVVRPRDCMLCLQRVQVCPVEQGTSRGASNNLCLDLDLTCSVDVISLHPCRSHR